MPKYVIERKVPGAEGMSADDLRAISQKSNDVLRKLGPDVQWVQSYIVDGHIMCVYNAANEDLIREHATLGGFPCDRILKVATTIDPVTGEG
jgi:hypothetical protein